MSSYPGRGNGHTTGAWLPRSPGARMTMEPAEPWVPWVAEREDEPSSPFSVFDSFGRKAPRRLGIADYLLVIARSEPARVRRVPPGAVAEDSEADAFVTCPCGARPVASEELAKCSGCERHYIRFDTGMVFVVYAGAVPPLRPLQ